MTGAKRRTRVVSAWYRVWYAASESRSERAFQKRERFRRTYHVDRSSEKVSIFRQAVWESYASSAARTSRTKRWRLETSQRSMTGRSRSGTTATVGSNRSRFAYVTKNAYVFQRISSLRLTSD